MRSVNEVTLIGNLTRDPEIRQTGAGQVICSFGVATNHDWTDNQGNHQSEAEFHNVIAWAKLGEFIGKYFHKGDAVYVKGRLKTRSWIDEGTGAKKFRTEIIARDVIQLRRINNNNDSKGGSNEEFIPQEENLNVSEMPAIENPV
ncbi:MAG: single-stranded DNA-binding protein [Patescibacteria group bacterium]|nr:single-stranded DNA-binding protein [Patescibacteria group bacterium]